MKLTATRSPKFRRLMQATGMSRVEAVGTLELLWLFTMEQAPSGDVGRWEDMDLEAELEWRGEPGDLIQALVDARWLDRCSQHRLVIHDWADHLPEFLQKRVDRGTLIIAKALPCPDDGGQRRTTGPNVPIREGKGREAKPSEGKGSEAGEGASASRPPRARRSPASPFPGSMGDRDWEELSRKHSVDPAKLREIAEGWAGEKDRGYTADGWRKAIDRALRDRWDWTRSLYATPGRPQQDTRESRVQAGERRTLEAVRRVAERLNEDPIQLAISATLKESA